MANPGFHPRMLRLAVAVAVETTTAMCERWDRSRLPGCAIVGHQSVSATTSQAAIELSLPVPLSVSGMGVRRKLFASGFAGPLID
eukprot:COSAG05_NODE_196_length_14546_cov_55.423548_2_plen_85_part_00